MTRRILLMRHAKSDWSDEALRDHDRPLNERGARDAPRMGRFLATRGLVPSRILCSTAVRAVETARLALDAMGDAAPVVSFLPGLYHAPAEAIAATIDADPDPAALLLVVGHNPGLEELVERIAGREAPMPTAAVALVQCRGSLRDAIAADGGGAVLLEHWWPKALAADPG